LPSIDTHHVGEFKDCHHAGEFKDGTERNNEIKTSSYTACP